MTTHNATLIEQSLDVCASRHKGNAQSRAANKRNSVTRSARREAVYNIIFDSPSTTKEVARKMGVALNTVSGRASELKYLGCIEPTNLTREGSAVLKACRPYSDDRVVKDSSTQLGFRSPTPSRPKSPSVIRKELADLEYLYDRTSLIADSHVYDAIKAKLLHQLELYAEGLL